MTADDWKTRGMIGCVGCQAPLATMRVSKPAGPHGYGVLQLEPGYVNAKDRHASGVAWYKPGPRRLVPSPTPRRPFVITCRECGKDTPVERG
jgi:hypothetical protein